MNSNWAICYTWDHNWKNFRLRVRHPDRAGPSTKPLASNSQLTPHSLSRTTLGGPQAWIRLSVCNLASLLHTTPGKLSLLVPLHGARCDHNLSIGHYQVSQAAGSRDFPCLTLINRWASLTPDRVTMASLTLELETSWFWEKHQLSPPWMAMGVTTLVIANSRSFGFL